MGGDGWAEESWDTGRNKSRRQKESDDWWAEDKSWGKGGKTGKGDDWWEEDTRKSRKHKSDKDDDGGGARWKAKSTDDGYGEEKSRRSRRDKDDSGGSWR